ncbi:hypothetical protein H6P81_018450 [Aristolochia fimbriata]|uniref:Amidase domain-containing protein n=1 Tax=Aristolochia fimbriata TaxID=158543 RepID=A0AAV7E2P0_ARIFI|nr:hypothetical protein H6P81_018450 [Aristolochia fimbriata]
MWRWPKFPRFAVESDGSQEKRRRIEEDEKPHVADTFTIEEATVEEIQSAFKQNKLTSRQLVDHYLKAIEDLNPTLRAVIEVNPDARRQADEADRNRDLPGGSKTNIHGIPLLLKDNIATNDKTNTTAGSVVLLNSKVPRNATVVANLRTAGAIILGKANLTEWAGIRGRVPEGWSARGLKAINPYKLSVSAGGSSTGSAVSVAANLVTVSLGTETYGSIITPSNVNGVVGIKPTLGLVSRAGVIPVTLRQDSIGPIGRTVSDAVHLLDAIVGYDPRDEITRDALQYIPTGGFNQCLRVGGLEKKRLGNLWHYYKDDYEKKASVAETFEAHFSTMSRKGASVIDNLELKYIDDFKKEINSQFIATSYEFKRDINIYLPNLLESQVRSLDDLIEMNKLHAEEEMPDGYDQAGFLLFNETSLPNEEYTEAVKELETICKEGLETFMQDNDLDAIVVPENKGSIILAIGGYPGIVVPAGFDQGLPFGIMFGGLKGSDAKLIEIAYAFEQATKVRKPPNIQTFLSDSAPKSNVDVAP